MYVGVTESLLMASLTIRKLDPVVKELIRQRAAREGHSMEEEVRRILSAACAGEAPADPGNALACMRRHFDEEVLTDVPLPERSEGRAPPMI